MNRIEDITGINFSLTLEEMDLLKDISEYAYPNPRKIKRLLNNYTFCRHLFPLDREKMIKWIVLCEQWPVRISWILHKLKDISQLGNKELQKEVLDMSLKEFYEEYVKWYIYDTKRKSWSPEIQAQYQKILVLDADDDVFEILIQRHNPLKISDIDDLEATPKSIKKKKLLKSLTFCLNSAISDMLDRAECFREDIAEFDQRRKKQLAHPTVRGYERCIIDQRKVEPGSDSVKGAGTGGTGTESDSQGSDVDGLIFDAHSSSSPRISTSTAIVEGPGNTGLLPSGGEAAEVATNDEKKESLTIATRAIKDDRTGKDYVGYTEYAKIKAALIVFKADHPFVVGILGQWGSGKSTIMTMVVAYIKYFVILDIVSRYIEKQKKVGNEKELESAKGCMDWIKSEFEKDRESITAIDMWVKLGFDAAKYDQVMKKGGGLDIDEIENLIDGRCPPFIWYFELLSVFLSAFELLNKVIESFMERYFPILTVPERHLSVLKRCILERRGMEKNQKTQQEGNKRSSVGLWLRRLVSCCCGENLAWRVVNGIDFVVQR